jgi:D-arabinose 1-dehydrogenase-like Zn-dependent alcohol dehydrogenase
MVDGGFSTHVIAPQARYCIEVPSNIGEEFAATLACSGLTAYGAIKKSLVDLPNGKFDDASNLCIFGAGGLGLQAIKIVRAMFPDYKPAVADIDPKKREAALAAGAAFVIDPNNTADMGANAGMAGKGFSRIIDFVGAGKSVEAATSLLKLGAGTLTVVGLFGGAATLPVSMIVMGWKLQGSGTGTLPGRPALLSSDLDLSASDAPTSQTEMKELAALAAQGKMDPIPIQNRKLEEANTILEELKAGKIIGRAVIKPNEA